MLKSILEALKALFSGLFKPSKDSGDTGGGGTVKPDPKPDTPPKLPQDGSEIQPDTIVIVANETEPVIVDPDTPVEEFDPTTLPGDKEIETNRPEPPQPETPPEEEPEEEPIVSPPPPKHNARFLWCLDNGHGKKTAGKRSPVFKHNGEDIRFFEYEFNRDIVNRIAKALDEKGVKYFITVPEVNVDDFLAERVNRANAKASDLPKIFVSIHSNAGPARSINHWAADNVSGIETWHYHNSSRGKKIAAVFQKHLIDNLGWKNRHLKSRPSGQFYVLRKTKMSAVLTENGFYNNQREVKELMKPEIRQLIADAHVAAILEIEERGVV